MPKYRLISIPDWLGSANRSGVEKGAPFLEKSILSSLRENFSGKPLHVNIPRPNPKHAEGAYKKIKYLPELKRIFKESRKKTSEIVESRKIPIILMGNDSSMIGTISGVSSVLGNNYGIIWFDAHGDINTPETSPSGKIYGMPLAHLLGYGNKELLKFNGKKPSLKIGNVIMIGQRSLDKGEIDFIRKNNIMAYSSKKANSMQAKNMFREISLKLRENKIKKLFVHIDLDSLDPVESPGVSMHEPGGLHVKRLLELVHLLASGFDKAGLSIAEYNPEKDINNETKNIALEIIRIYLEAA